MDNDRQDVLPKTRAFERGDRVYHGKIQEYGTVNRVGSGFVSEWIDVRFTYIGGHRVQGESLKHLERIR